jgi:hypothetical protein
VIELSGQLLTMNKSDIQCPDCAAGYRRIELVPKKGKPGQYRCLICARVLEVFDGSSEIAYRLTVPPTVAMAYAKLSDE